MPALRLTGFLMILLTAGCAAVEHAPPGSGTAPALASPAPGPATGAPTVTAAPVAAAAPAAPEVAEPVPPRAPSRTPSKEVGGAKAAPPAAKPVAKAPAPSAPPAPAAPTAPASTGASVTAPSPAKPPLDLNALEARLRATDAIGMFTKIALKNQVEDLLDQFRDFYAGKAKISLADLRPPYDRLLLKLLALLQDEDPDLARAIADSREPMWSILADPARFATL
jgi:hypothetical protein